MVAKEQVNEVVSSLPSTAMDPRVSVVGVGGAGCNVVSALYERELQGLELVAVNTDETSLHKARADVKTLLKKPPHGILGEEEAELAIDAARPALERALNTEVLFLVTGMGGRTGTLVSPLLAEMANQSGALVISIAMMPFEMEGRAEVASKGLQRLKETSHTVLVADNNNLLNFNDIGFNDAMTLVNKMVSTLIESVMERLTSPCLSSLAEEVQIATQTAGPDSESVEFEIPAPSGISANDDMKPVGFDDKGFIGYA